jgi:hypothetical protein
MPSDRKEPNHYFDGSALFVWHTLHIIYVRAKEKRIADTMAWLLEDEAGAKRKAG